MLAPVIGSACSAHGAQVTPSSGASSPHPSSRHSARLKSYSIWKVEPGSGLYLGDVHIL
jgi:hypothetical protein